MNLWVDIGKTTEPTSIDFGEIAKPYSGQVGLGYVENVGDVPVYIAFSVGGLPEGATTVMALSDGDPGADNLDEGEICQTALSSLTGWTRFEIRLTAPIDAPRWTFDSIVITWHGHETP